MKNKIVSAMLVGMSATMAVPGTAVFADDLSFEEPAVEGVAAETPVENAVAAEENLPADDYIPEEQPAVEEVKEEPTAEELKMAMDAYATDEASKLTDTPSDFTSKLESVKFEKEVFGKYSDRLNDIMKDASLDKSSLYNCEMDVISKAEQAASDEEDKTVQSLKYAIAKQFESVFGEDAFKAGRDVRRNILAEAGMDKDDEFASSESVSAADDIYKMAGGVTDAPKTLLPEEETEPQKAMYEYVTGMDDITMNAGEEIPEPSVSFDAEHVISVSVDKSTVDKDTAGIYKIVFSIKGVDGSTMDIEKNCIVQGNAGDAYQENEDGQEAIVTKQDPTITTASNLADSVYGMTDLEMQVGESVPVINLTYDETKIASVTTDTSAVNTSAVGTYKIIYRITGVDGTVENVERVCTVSEDSEVVRLREDMCKQIDALGKDKFTEARYQKKWDETANAAKAQIRKLKTAEEMQAVVDSASKATDDIVAAQQLYIAKQGYLKLLNEYYDSFVFDSDSLKEMADEVMKNTEADINESTTVDEASKALDAGKAELRKIGDQDSSVLSELKDKVREKINKERSSIKDDTSITDNVYNALIARLSASVKAKEIDSVSNTAGRAFAHVRKGLGGDMSAMLELNKDMKGIAADSDTTETIEQVIGLGTPKDIEEAEYRVSDICKAITSELEDFIKYLLGRAGQIVEGNTKAEAYKAYLKITNGIPDKELEEARKAARTEINNAVDAISTSTTEMSQKKETIRANALKLIDEATTKEEVDKALAKAKSDIEVFAKEAEASKGLEESKEAAKKKMRSLVNSQTDASVKESISAMLTIAESKLDAAATADEVNSIVTEFEKDAKAVIDAAQKGNAELAAAKSNALTKLNSLTDGVKSEYITSDMTAIVNNAKAKVEAAQAPDECTKAYEEAKQSFKSAYLISMRTVFGNRIDSLMPSNLADEAVKKQIQAVIDTQKSNLQQATNEETMTKCYELAKTNVEKLIATANANTGLDAAKTNAIEKLKNSYSNLTDDQKKVLDKYVQAIQAATSEDQINELLTKGNAAMEAAGATSNSSGSNTSEPNTLAAAKADAISSLTNMANTAPEANKEEAQKILNDYIAKINAATTTDEVSQLKEAGINALSKYGADSNAAVPNGNTSTTVGSGSSAGDASEKGSVEGTTTVKTGDDNMSMIAAASAAIMAAGAAIFVSLRKFLKK